MGVFSTTNEPLCMSCDLANSIENFWVSIENLRGYIYECGNEFLRFKGLKEAIAWVKHKEATSWNFLGLLLGYACMSYTYILDQLLKP